MAYSITPPIAKQGDLLRFTGDAAAKRVRLNGRTAPLYNGAGLMAVPTLTEPGVYGLEWLDEKGAVLRWAKLRVNDAHFPVQNVILSKALTELRSTTDERDDVGAFLKIDSPVRYWSLPIKTPLQSCLTSMFGVRRAHNGNLTGEFHGGLDQRGATGTPIHAVTGGEVKLAGQFALHGGTVGIDHGQGLESMYLHMSRIAAKVGERVEAGDVIGYVGSTGRSTGSHLHWSLYAHGEPVNPLQWVALRPCADKAAKKTAVRRKKQV